MNCHGEGGKCLRRIFDCEAARRGFKSREDAQQ